MGIFKSASDILKGMLYGGTVGASYLQATEVMAEEGRIAVQEGVPNLAEIELAADAAGWQDLATGNKWDFSRSGLMSMVSLSRVMYLINPLIKRAVTVQELYVWGSGCNIKASSEAVQEVISDFFNDPKNQGVIGDGWPEREREQRIDGNTFFVFFRNKLTGVARVRLLSILNIEDVIHNPEDAHETWFYKYRIPESPDLPGRTQYELLPSIDYYPRSIDRSKLSVSNQDIPINWEKRVLHVKTGGLSSMKFGMPELYCTLNWATAYKRILENFATILAAYARVAMKVSGMGAKKVAASKAKLKTGMDEIPLDKNPPPNTGAWALLSGTADIQAVKTANSTTGPDEARALRSMVAAGSDTPEHFFGDSDIGNFATSTTLDRPTELKMVSRQKMWADIIERICSYLVIWSAQAPQGKLKDRGFKFANAIDAFDGSSLYKVTPPQGQKLSVTITFPPIVEREVVERVRAVVQAATLGGSSAEGIIPDRKFLFRLLMVALGQKNVDELTNDMYPESIKQGFIDPKDKLENERMKAEGSRDLGEAAITAANQPRPQPKSNGSAAAAS